MVKLLSTVVAALLATSASAAVVKGKAFDRFVTIWLENTDYDKAKGDPSLAALAKKGITLSNYFAVTHPSQPNYIASFGGDNFGMQHDSKTDIANNVASVADLLDEQSISWGAYQEDMPSTGFLGDYKNPKTKANMYVRKHNPPVSYLSVTQSQPRLDVIRNLTLFQRDLKANTLPQWLFITPNMTSDGHDSSVTVAGTWTKNFLTPLLNDKNFMQNTLVLVTFDENHTYSSQNRVFSILLGDAVPAELVGTTDTSFYDHYSELSTVEANWGLHTLGRWDSGANVFKLVADKTGDSIRTWPAVTGSKPTFFLNESYPGPLNDEESAPYPVPNVNAVVNGRAVLPAVVSAWSGSTRKTIYNTGIEIPDGQHPPAGL